MFGFCQCELWLISIAGLGFGFGHGILYYAEFFHWFGFRLWCHRDGDLSWGWRSVPKMGPVTIWERDLNPNQSPSPCSENVFCIIACRHSIWNPSPNQNQSPAVEWSHKALWLIQTELMAHLHHWTRIWVLTQTWIPNRMATLYYAEHFTLHRLGLRSLLPFLYRNPSLSPYPNPSPAM